MRAVPLLALTALVALAAPTGAQVQTGPAAPGPDLAAPAVAEAQTAPAATLDPARRVRLPLNVSLVPGLSVGDAVASRTGAEVVNGLSWNVVAGRSAHLDGAEFGAVWNGYTGGVRGAQFAGALNTVGGDVRGAQFAGAINAVGGDARGAQFAGAANVVRGDWQGAQFAGAANVVGGTAGGAQVAGAVNVAGRATGLQLGVVNVAGEHTGVPVGLVSYVRDVGLRYDAWGDETGLATVALRTGNRRFSNYLGVAARPGADDAYRWGFVVGFGAEVPVGGRAYGALEALTYGLHGATWGDVSNLSRLRLLGGYRVTDRAALFAGPTFNAFVSDDLDGAALAPWSVYDAETGGAHVRLWPGFTVGARFATNAL